MPEGTFSDIAASTLRPETIPNTWDKLFITQNDIQSPKLTAQLNAINTRIGGNIPPNRQRLHFMLDDIYARRRKHKALLYCS